MMAATSERNTKEKHKTSNQQETMFEKIVELLASIAASLATIAGNGGTIAASTVTTAPASSPAPAAGEPAKKRGRPATGTPPAGSPTTPQATPVTLQELKDIFMPWIKADATQTAARTAQLNGVLDEFRDSPNVALSAMDPALFAEMKPRIEALVKGGAAASADDCPV
jgi:hypothetical protein